MHFQVYSILQGYGLVTKYFPLCILYQKLLGFMLGIFAKFRLLYRLTVVISTMN